MRIEARQRDSHRPEGHSTNLELDVDHRRLSMCAWNDAAERHAVATMPPCRWAVWPMQAERDGEVLIETSQMLVARVDQGVDQLPRAAPVEDPDRLDPLESAPRGLEGSGHVPRRVEWPELFGAGLGPRRCTAQDGAR